MTRAGVLRPKGIGVYKGQQEGQGDSREQLRRTVLSTVRPRSQRA